ncbi:cytoplasmic tRNA 2-thiolation protein 2 isoform X2 [Protopterus annectens]|nr:cytoplasmic tRNA 2-thiolation protein 2 isoform X2 [Protopterus annectens]
MQKCMRCKEGAAVVIIRVGDAFCKDCFKDYFVHKFRAMLGKNRLIYPGEKVLLALSGGAASSALLRQVQEGLSREAPKKLRFIPGIVHIDEGGLTSQSLEDRQDVLFQLESVFKASGFPYYILSLEEVFDLPTSILQREPAFIQHGRSYKDAVDGFIHQHISQHDSNVTLQESPLSERLCQLGIQDSLQEDVQATGTGAGVHHKCTFSARQTTSLRSLFSSVKSLTSKEELLQNLRNHLILHVARAHGYSKVMFGDSCTRLAVKLLTNICQGRGAFLAADTGFSDNRYGDPILVRPMRDYSSKEIAFYNKLFNVPSVFVPSLDTKISEKASIHRLTESFICKLQSDFPSTVSTIYRTSEKLNVAPSSSAELSETTERCLLCLCTLDTHVGEASSFHATVLSEKLSQRKSADHICATASTEGAEKEPSNSKSFTNTEFLALLCYSCRVIIKDMVTPTQLPQYVVLEADHRIRRAKMREEIQDFLICKEDERTTAKP